MMPFISYSESGSSEGSGVVAQNPMWTTLKSSPRHLLYLISSHSLAADTFLFSEFLPHTGSKLTGHISLHTSGLGNIIPIIGISCNIWIIMSVTGRTILHIAHPSQLTRNSECVNATHIAFGKISCYIISPERTKNYAQAVSRNDHAFLYWHLSLRNHEFGRNRHVKNLEATKMTIKCQCLAAVCETVPEMGTPL